MKKWLFKNRFIILLTIIILIGAFFRFYQLSDRLYFQLDEERDWHMFRRSIVYHRPPLIGSYLPPGLYLGPLWIYISALIGLLLKLNPFSYGFLASILGVIAIPLIYQVGFRIFKDKRVGLVASLLYSFSYLAAIYSRNWWPLVFSPLATLIVYYSLIKIINGKLRWAWPMFISLTLALHGEPPNLTTLFLILISIPIFKIKWRSSHFLGGLTLLIISHLTLLIFEFRHQFTITKALLALITKLGSPSLSNSPISLVIPQIIRSFARFIYPSGRLDTVFQIGWCPEYLQEIINSTPSWLNLLSALILILFILFTFRYFRHRALGYQLISLHLIILVISLLFFSVASGTPIYEWFFYHLFPIFSLIWAAVLVFLFSGHNKHFFLLPKFVATAVLFIVCGINFRAQLIAKNSHSLGFRQQAVNFAISSLPQNANFSIESIGKCFAWSGYRTLFIQKNRQPVNSYLDELFGSWLYPAEIKNIQPTWQAIFVDHEDNLKIHLPDTNLRARFGDIEVFILPADAPKMEPLTEQPLGVQMYSNDRQKESKEEKF